MTIAIEVVAVLVGVALLAGFFVSRFSKSLAEEDEKPKRSISTQNITSELERLFSLFQSGALTTDEYQELKERLLSGQSAAVPMLSGDWQAHVEEELRANRKIEAIKLYRQATNLGLKESKDAVEEIERRLKSGF